MPAVRGTGGRTFLLAAQRGALIGPPDHDRRLITGYEQARRFLVDPRHSRASVLQVPSGPASAMSVTNMDAPQHSHIRALLDTAFSARAVARLLPAIEHRANALVARMRAAGPACDALAEFCVPFAYAVHCDMLGVPEHTRQTLYRWSCARSKEPDIGGSALYQAELGLHSAVGEMLDHPYDLRPGLLRDLLGVHRSGGLAAGELKGLAASLFFDGHILSANQLANTLLCLFVHPDWLARLIAEPGLLDATVEETLRYSPAITVGMPRVIATNVLAAVAFGLANRDHAVFEAPDRFDPTRTGPRHLSFGRGPHHCLGAALMRAELRIALTTLLTHLPRPRPAVEDHALAWTSTSTVRGLSGLSIAWDG